jgi:nicotinate phosphoribosyltransferase
MATNALRLRFRAPRATLLEFGLRRAQGPDGGMSASRYSYIGGFDGTSNVLAGHRFGIPIAGTVAHSFVMSFSSASQLRTRMIKESKGDDLIDMLEIARGYISENGFKANEQELVAFISQAITYPTNFLALVDSYDTLRSGIPNFLAVCCALDKAGYRGKGVRLDSGDLASLSRAVRAMFTEFAAKYDIPYARNFIISASNDINESELIRLDREGHEITSFGIGTHLVTCQSQPALGGVYKLVEVSGLPRVKLSDSVDKSSIPARKEVYRLYDTQKREVADLLTETGEEVAPGTITAFRIYPDAGRVTLDVAEVKNMLVPAWTGGVASVDGIAAARRRVTEARSSFNPAVLAVVDTTPYQVLISERLYRTVDRLINEVNVE